MHEKATGLSGCLIIDKPEGPTSHDIVSQIRKLIRHAAQPRDRRRRFYVGHAGTLDPFATGVLIVALGSATRLLEYTHDLPKTYLATITLGATSDTDDRTGKITAFSPLRRGRARVKRGEGVASREQILQVLQTFLGPIEQIPPAYSAVKVKGKKLYEYARKGIGESVLRKPRPVIIHSIKLLAYDYPNLELEITCGGGTYIRALARDIGEALGTGAYVQELRRTAIGPFDLSRAIALDKLSTPRLDDSLGVNSLPLLPPEKLVEHLSRITLDPTSVAKFKQGVPVGHFAVQPRGEAAWSLAPLRGELYGVNKPTAIFDQSNSLIGIGRFDPTTSFLRPSKNL